MSTISYSQITKHRQCPQAWKYAYVDRLDKDIDLPQVERDFGTWWHAVRAADAMERSWKHFGDMNSPYLHHPEALQVPGGSISDVQVSTSGGSPAVIFEAEKAWERATPDYRDAFLETFGQTLPHRLVALDSAWREEHAAEIENEVPLAVELRWERELPGTDRVLVGYVDEVFYDTRRRILMVRDHKSHKSLGQTSALDDMMDSQLQLYAWGLVPLVTAWWADEFGPIRAVAYDRVRSVAPKEPALTATGALSKSITDYDAETYVKWAAKGQTWGEEGKFYVSGAKKGQPKFGTYEVEQAVIERLESPIERAKWFQRTRVPLNPALVKAHLQAAVDSAVAIKRDEARAERRGEVARNLTKNCSWCPFAGLCRAQMFGGANGEYDLAAYGLAVKPGRA